MSENTNTADAATVGEPYSTASDLTHKLLNGTVARVYYALPGYGTVGEEFSDLHGAASVARERVARIKAGAEGAFVKPEVTLDTRMVVTCTGGGSQDFIHERTIIRD